MAFDRNTDFSRMTNSEINIKIMGYNNEYDVRKTKILDLISELEDLDYLYNKAKKELDNRGILSNE